MSFRARLVGLWAVLVCGCSPSGFGEQEDSDRGEPVAAVALPLGPALALSELQPIFSNAGTEYPWAGRVTAGSIDPTDANIAIVASDRGGLWRTTDGGVNWTHIDGFEPFTMNSVRISPRNRNIVLATILSDLHNPSQAGIWRSTDGGVTWQQPSSAVPATGPTRGFGISFSPDSDHVYVGTDVGVAISDDEGATWTHVDPSPNTGTVFHVEAQPGGIVNAMAQCSFPTATTCDEDPTDPDIQPPSAAAQDIPVCNGFHRSANFGASWPVTGPDPLGGAAWIHSIAVSPFDPNVVLAIGVRNPAPGSTFCRRFDVFESDDGGVSFTSLNAPVTEGNGRPPFVGAHASANGLANNFDVYYSDNTLMWRQTCSGTGPGLRCSTTWQSVNIGFPGHVDNVDIAWSNADNCPRLLMGDGGPQTTPDCGASWQVTGNGPGGFHALQFWDMTGTVHTDHTDLYFLTQDNGNWASSDGGNTWPTNSACAEGFNLEVVHSTPADTQSVGYVGCGNCTYFRQDAHFTLPLTPWNNPPSTRPSSGMVAVANNTWLQFAQPLLPPPNTTPPVDADNNLYISTDNAANWTQVTGGTITETFRNFPINNVGTLDRGRIGGPAGSPTLYMPALKPANSALGLKRITNFLGGSATVTNADNGIVISTNSYGFPVWNVDPSNAARLMAVDAVTNQVVISTNNGANWTPNNLATTTASGSGDFFFGFQGFDGSGNVVNGFTSVNAMAFDNSNGTRMLIATEGNGIMATFDSGTSWVKIPGSDRIPAITSMFFDERTADVYIGTYGRGLWKMGWCSDTGGPDTTPPSFTFVPPDIRTSNCGTIDIGSARAVDVCGGGGVTITNNRPAKFPPGTTLVTWTATDAAGNTTTATQRVTLILRDDPACCPVGSNVILGTSNNDTLTGTTGSDCIFGRGAQDAINGGGGNDFISAGHGDDIVNAGGADDIVFGGPGQDQLNGDDGNDTLFGDDGDDTLNGGTGNDTLRGGQGQDQLNGQDHDDTLFGEDGSDTLNGGAGNDHLVGGTGTSDSCTGGAGTNTFATCETPATDSCADGIVNGTETDVDCGGGCAQKCPDGDSCVSGNDCSSLLCAVGVCAPSSGIATSTTGLLQASLTITSDWGGGYCAALDVINNALVPTINWNVNVNIPGATTFTTWNGSFTNNTGAVVVSPLFSWNQVILAEGTDNSIGFCANRSVAGSLPSITGATGIYF
jgi:Ca2+-binding RTX toxin-like protein